MHTIALEQLLSYPIIEAIPDFIKGRDTEACNPSESSIGEAWMDAYREFQEQLLLGEIAEGERAYCN